MKSESIVLIGMAGVGKSTVGTLLSKTLGFTFIDLDDYIFKKEGKTVQEIIDEKGEEAFLQLEKRRMYEVDLNRKVVAPGGSIIYHPDLMEYLRQNSTIVYLDDSFKDIEKRITSLSTRGIVGLSNRPLKQIYKERKPLYARHAEITVDCQGKSQDQLAKEILHRYKSLEKSENNFTIL